MVFFALSVLRVLAQVYCTPQAPSNVLGSSWDALGLLFGAPGLVLGGFRSL